MIKYIFLFIVLLFQVMVIKNPCRSNNVYGINPCSPSNSDSERRFKMEIWQQQRKQNADEFFQKRLESVRKNRYNWRNKLK